MKSAKKYHPDNLIPMFRLAAALRKQMLDTGFTDNGGAIHSAERILGILGLRLCYPDLNHINNLRNLPNAAFSEQALVAHKAGEKVLIEHVNPHRALTRLAIEKIEANISDDEFKEFVKSHFQLALLTKAETLRLNKLNRSRIVPDRLQSAGIRLAVPGVDSTN
ncbi:TPA: hypothetical protein SL211_005363 [Pseudomonas aeruginosa]|uniref:hypothetical protein n=1 Tax=Pseudomonas aeruginosa TaxID=287 RepID=UPI0008FB1A15|nr:hypothetical protein [Pseudomonas aeruginosa]MBH3542515.1 hypothetical protein [Pseudomonas aeruginosa]MBI7403660.1 hypothetical protein [Pseudomonas aeruginosa]MBI7433970.1 hypothetical protein [Pseudomonas aeruginosa]MCD2749155.1 hypothetical protein [Pseudomonas aeruginosa]MCO3305808.1 hypothetical protein [Pseudomonas aeruginosa]